MLLECSQIDLKPLRRKPILRRQIQDAEYPCGVIGLLALVDQDGEDRLRAFLASQDPLALRPHQLLVCLRPPRFIEVDERDASAALGNDQAVRVVAVPLSSNLAHDLSAIRRLPPVWPRPNRPLRHAGEASTIPRRGRCSCSTRASHRQTR